MSLTPEQERLSAKLTTLQRRTVLGVVAGLSNRQAYYAAGGTAKSDESADATASGILRTPAALEFKMRLQSAKAEQSLLESMVCVMPDVLESLKSIFPTKSELDGFVNATLLQAVCAIENGRVFAATRQKATINSPKRYAVFFRAGFKCQACGASPKSDNEVKLHVDHILPKSLGGGEQSHNLQALCLECNISKGNRFTVNHHHEEGSL